jgi:predicted enzyme related to lactoylglutathione lyase
VFLYGEEVPASGSFFERTLGFAPVERDDGSVKFDAGSVLLALNARPGPAERDPTTLFVLHVDDAEAARAALTAAGVATGPVDRYDIGATADFFDRDGHYFTVYEPSPEALDWPSATRLRKLALRTPGGGPPLGGRPLVYLFHFVLDAQRARAFYSGVLGLSEIEVDESIPVVKYDLGDILLATHLADDERTIAALSTARTARSALVLQVSDCATTASALRDTGVDVAPMRSSAIGVTAAFTDPDGHEFYLYEASQQARRWPSGRWLRDAVDAVTTAGRRE